MTLKPVYVNLRQGNVTEAEMVQAFVPYLNVTKNTHYLVTELTWKYSPSKSYRFDYVAWLPETEELTIYEFKAKTADLTTLSQLDEYLWVIQNYPYGCVAAYPDKPDLRSTPDWHRYATNGVIVCFEAAEPLVRRVEQLPNISIVYIKRN